MDTVRDLIRSIFVPALETWDVSKEDTSVVPFTQTYSDLLLKQVPFLWTRLDSEEKEWVMYKTEQFRQKRGAIVSRTSVEYVNFFTQTVVDTCKWNPDTGEIDLKKKILLDFEATKKGLWPYNPETGQTLRFKKFFGIQEDQNVYLVTDESTGKNWILKWEEYVSENSESKTYRKLENLGANVPERLEGFKVLDFGVLVLEFLYPMDITDRPSQVARQLLQQLKAIHTFACYFDLKTDNIRKRNSDPPAYFIIDMNLSTEMRPDGTFKRLHWTPLYSSQLFPSGPNVRQRSSYKNDFIELKYVLHQMIAKRAYETNYHIFADPNRYEKTERFGLRSDDFFADPDRMNANPISETARGWRCMKTLLEFPPPLSWMPTQRFHDAIESLEHGFPPANIHNLLADQIDLDHENRFFKETEKLLTIQCSICDSRQAIGKCSECYSQVTFVCSKVCAGQHTCK